MSTKKNSPEKTIGILGLAPYATLDFYGKILNYTDAKKDWHHVKILIDSDPKIPSRGRHLELNEEDPTPKIRLGVLKLLEMGADFVCIPCNTAHYFYEGYSIGLTDKVINIIKVTCDFVAHTYPQICTIGLLASSSTVKYDLYSKFQEKNSFSFISPINRQSEITELIEAVKQNTISESDKITFKDLCLGLHRDGAECIVLGCTELNALISDFEFPIPIIDSSSVYAKYALDLAQNRI